MEWVSPIRPYLSFLTICARLKKNVAKRPRPYYRYCAKRASDRTYLFFMLLSPYFARLGSIRAQARPISPVWAQYGLKRALFRPFGLNTGSSAPMCSLRCAHTAPATLLPPAGAIRYAATAMCSGYCPARIRRSSSPRQALGLDRSTAQ